MQPLLNPHALEGPLTVGVLTDNLQHCLELFELLLVAGERHQAKSPQDPAKQLLAATHALAHSVLDSVGALATLGRVVVPKMCIASTARDSGSTAKAESTFHDLANFDVCLRDLTNDAEILTRYLSDSEQDCIGASVAQAIIRTRRCYRLAESLLASSHAFVRCWPASSRAMDIRKGVEPEVCDLLWALSHCQPLPAPLGTDAQIWALVIEQAECLHTSLCQLAIRTHHPVQTDHQPLASVHALPATSTALH